MTTAPTTTPTRPQQSAADAIRRYASDPLVFAADLHVPLGGGVGRLGDAWAEFQRKDFEALAPSLLAVARGEVAPIRRFWIERTKGGSKDSDVTICVLWLLLFAPRPVRVQVGAYDAQQASEIKFIAKQILSADAPLNRLVASKVEVQKDRLIAHADTPGRTESVCEILTTDAYGSHGARPDVVIANELTHVGSEAFMQTLMDNADKVPHSIVITATNSGEVGTWQEKWRDIARDSDRWYMSVLDKPAPWVSEADLAESRLRNPLHRFNRLWLGVWSSGDGEGIDPADVAACTVLERPLPHSPHCFFCGGIDLGLKLDRAAVTVLCADPHRGLVSLAACQSFDPKNYGGEVPLGEVQRIITRLHHAYGVCVWKADPWNLGMMKQNLDRAGIGISERNFVPKQIALMATSLLDAFRSRCVNLYHDEELEQGLLMLKIKETSVGFSLTAARNRIGHADKAFSLAIALPEALYAARNFGADQMRQQQMVQRIIT